MLPWNSAATRKTRSLMHFLSASARDVATANQFSPHPHRDAQSESARTNAGNAQLIVAKPP